MSVLSQIIEASLNYARPRLILTAMKTNRLFDWWHRKEAAEFKHYQDMSIELDMIHEYVDDEHRYMG